MSGPEGTPNGVDRLERIEAVARTTREAWGTNAYADDVLALVEIAKAARLIRASDQTCGNDWWQAHAKLYVALARLDSGGH